MNLPLSLLLLMGSGLLIYSGIKNPSGGVVGVLGSALKGQAPVPPLNPKIVAGLTAPASSIPKTKPPTVSGLISGGLLP